MFDFLRNLTQSAEEKRQQAITAYLDDMMSPNERERFAAQLAQDAELQAAVARERAVKQSLSRLPQRRVPRNFTLDPARYGRPAKQPLIQAYPVLRAATGLAAVFFIFALVAGLYLGGSPAPQAAESAGGMIAMDTAVEQEAETAAEEPIEETVQEEAAPAAEEPAPFAEMTEEPAEEEMIAEEEAVEEAAPAAPLPDSDGTTTNREAPTGAEDAESSPSPTLTIAATPTAAPTATISQLPRATATNEFADRAITTTTDTGDTMETDAGEIAIAATALPMDEFAEGTAVPEQREQPATQPVSTLLIIQISLLLLLIILGALTFYTRRQL